MPSSRSTSLPSARSCLIQRSSAATAWRRNIRHRYGRAGNSCSSDGSTVNDLVRLTRGPTYVPEVRWSARASSASARGGAPPGVAARGDRDSGADRRAAACHRGVLRAAGRHGLRHHLVRQRFLAVRICHAPGRRAGWLVDPRPVHGRSAPRRVHVCALRRHRQTGGHPRHFGAVARTAHRSHRTRAVGAGAVAFLPRLRAWSGCRALGARPGAVCQWLRALRGARRRLHGQLVVRDEWLWPAVRRAACAAGDGGHARAGPRHPSAPPRRLGLLVPQVALLSAVIALLHPFHAPVLLGAILLAGLAFWRSGRGLTNLVAAIVAGAAALPALVPTVLTFSLQPFWVTTYSSQNLLPSPAPHELLVDLGATLLLALAGAFMLRGKVAPFGVLLWLLLALIAMYLPVPYQRRFSFGIQPLLAVLGANTIVAACARLSQRRAAAFRLATVAFAGSSTALVIVSVVASGFTNGLFFNDTATT